MKHLPAHHIEDILFSSEQLQKRISDLVTEMLEDCRSDNLVIVGVLRGSFIFIADLVRELYAHGVHPRIDFATMESYGAGTESSGNVCIAKDVMVHLADADAILVDDILDTGQTLSFAVKHLRNKGARSVKTCVLLDKPSRRVVNITADYVGFTVPDSFVVGYGLDYDSYYRELPNIARVTFT